MDLQISQRAVAFSIFISLVSGCGGDDEESCDVVANTGCDGTQVCELVQGGEPACFAAVVVKGRVFDLQTDAAVAGARMVALDGKNAPTSSVAVSGSDGAYTLAIPTQRDVEGVPTASATITLRADAAGYVSFPAGIRQALPFDTSDPVLLDGEYVIASALTDLGLLPIAGGGPATGTIHGRVAANDSSASVTVVAELTGKGYSAIAGRDNNYVLFNVPVGSYQVAGYAKGFNYTTAPAIVTAGGDVEANLDVDAARAASTVSGSVQIVNGQLGTATSVILVVESTFDAVLERGETPAGLRSPDPGIAPNVNGSFAITGVPAGRYVVLAAFENDNLVRDASSIGGTEIVHQEVVAGQDVAITTSFKVTGAVDIVAPGATGPETISGNPTFSWLDDSSEDRYEVTVFDGYGNIVWTAGTPKSVVTLPYAGPALVAGMYYQFRVLSIKDPAEQISKSEDLRGVFSVP